MFVCLPLVHYMILYCIDLITLFFPNFTNFNPLQGEDVEEVGEDVAAEGKKRKKKRSSKKTAAVEEDEQGGGKEEEEPSLIDIGSKESSPAPAAALATKTESPRKKSPARDTKKQGEIKKDCLKHMCIHTFCPCTICITETWGVGPGSTCVCLWITFFHENFPVYMLHVCYQEILMIWSFGCRLTPHQPSSRPHPPLNHQQLPLRTRPPRHHHQRRDQRKRVELRWSLRLRSPLSLVR